jgi:hypothetical protein
MKNSLFRIITLLTLVVLAVPSVRAEEAVKEKPIGKKTLAKYDADKDGKLSEDEKAVRESDQAKAKAERKAKRDAAKQNPPAETK